MRAAAGFLPAAAVLGAVASVALGASFAKSLFPVLGPGGTVTLRVSFAALALLLFWRPWRLPLEPGRAGFIAVYGAALGAMNLSFYVALQTLPVGLATAIEFTGPLAVAVASSRRRLDFLWIACAAAGLVMLLPLSAGAAAPDPIGVAFAFVAATCWAIYIVFGQKAGAGHAGQATSLGMATAVVVAAPFGFGQIGPAMVDPRLLAAGVALAMLSSVLPYSLEMYALRRLPRQTFGVLLSLEPALCALAALVILGERLSPVQWLAVSAIMAASIGAALSVKRPIASSE